MSVVITPDYAGTKKNDAVEKKEATKKDAPKKPTSSKK
jgi:hypothetical protein